MRLIMIEVLIMNFGGSYLIRNICIHYCVMSRVALRPGVPSGGAIDPALLESALKLLQRPSYCLTSRWRCGPTAPQAGTRAFSSTMMLTSTLER